MHISVILSYVKNNRSSRNFFSLGINGQIGIRENVPILINKKDKHA